MQDPREWYQDQVVFLTGGTGNLGGCLLYKLAIKLPTRKIYVLCRGSVRQAIETLEASMPDQIDDILNTHKIIFMIGDTTKPSIGLKSSDIEQLSAEVTVVINAAGDISLRQPLSRAIVVNCVAHLTLIELLKSFCRLRVLLHISTTSVNYFLPNGLIQERLYPVSEHELDAATQISSIQATGESALSHVFPAPYAQAKHLAEKAILNEADLSFPILVVRPSMLAPAIYEPYCLYGPNKSIPVHGMIQILVTSSDQGLTQVNQQISPQTVIDEVPVDLVADFCLAHLAEGTTGIIHAAADLYKKWRLSEVALRCYKYIPPTVSKDVTRMMPQAEALAPFFFGIVQQYCRDWDIQCRKSGRLDRASTMLPDLTKHDPEFFIKQRCDRLSKTVVNQLRQTVISPLSGFTGSGSNY